MGIYQSFKTDADLEQRGVILDFGDYRVRIARAGGANLRFARVFEAKTKPFRRAIQNETLSEDKAKEIAYESYAEAIVLGWDTPVDNGDGTVRYEPYILDDEGNQIPYSKENVIKTFKEVPDFFLTMQAEAQRVSNFRREAQEDEAKNS